MSFSHTLLEELQLPSGITTLGERTKPDFWRREGHQAIFVQRWERRCKVFLRSPSPVQETADDLKNHLMAAVEDKKADADEIGRAAQNTLSDGQRMGESGRIDAESKTKNLRSKGRVYVRRQALSILPMLVAVFLVGLLSLFARVVCFFPGSRRSGNRQRRSLA